MKRNIAVLLGALALLAGCAEVGYDLVQDYAQENCRKLGDSDRAACLKNAQTDYQTYRRDTYDKRR